MQRKTITMSEVMPPERANFTRHIHGGYILLLADRVAYACGVRYAGMDVVTLSVDQVIFKQPIAVGDLVTFHASVNFVGRTSMEIGIKVIAENLKTGETCHTNTCFFTMVAIDAEGRPQALPPLALENDTEKRRFQEGNLRRALRDEIQKRHAEIKATHQET